MVNRNDLSAYKKPGDDKPVLAEPAPARKRGVKVKPAAEKRSEKVLLSLTPSEHAAIKARAGLAPIATYITAKLQEAGELD